MKTNDPAQASAVPSYVYSSLTKPSITTNHQVSEQKENKPLPKTTDSLLNPHVAHVTTSNQTTSTGSPSHQYQENNLSRSNRNKTILQILHSAIAEKQTYPEASIQLKESGTVKLGFLLSPDGTLSNISIIHSSGFPNIDAAAVNAVNASSPVKTAGSYIQHQEHFTVDVVFR